MSNVTNISRNQHVILLYENNSNRNLALINSINQGMHEEQHCIYASVHAHDASHNKYIIANQES